MGIEEALAIWEGSHSKRLRDCTSHAPVMASTNSQSFQQKMENDYNARRKAYQRDRVMRATVVEKTFWSSAALSSQTHDTNTIAILCL
jgi:hypothetical protein